MSEGIKKSQFTAAQTIAESSTFDFVTTAGENLKITKADLLAALGTTGTISQEGDPLGTPVLDVQGSANLIRNLENGSGVKASVSPQNGITLDHNFITDSTGVELVVDLTADTPKFRSIVGSAGVNVAAANGVIQVALSGTPASTKTVVVNQLSDLPAPIGGVITLADNTEYAVRNDVTTADRFFVGDNCVISGSDAAVVNLVYTGTGVMFTSVNNTWRLKSITVTASTGTLLAISGTGAQIFQLTDAVAICDDLGDISGMAGMQFASLQAVVVTKGLTFSGANGVMLVSGVLSTISIGTLFDLGTSIFDGVSISDCFSTLAAGTFFISGLANSGNINAGGLGSVYNCRFFGAGTPLDTISLADKQWQFFINDVIADTHPAAMVALSGNVTNTVIAVASTPVLIAGTWLLTGAQQFDTTVGGRATYDGVKDSPFDITASFTAAPISGTNKVIGFLVAVNGVTVAASEAKSNISSGDLKRTTVVWRVVLAPGDYIEAYIENTSDTTNILVTDAVLRVS